MLHLGAVLPNFTFAADAHYHHLIDDVITGGKLKYENGAIRVPTGPGLGVRLDDRVDMYAALYHRLGSYPYDRDPARPDWFAVRGAACHHATSRSSKRIRPTRFAIAV